MKIWQELQDQIQFVKDQYKKRISQNLKLSDQGIVLYLMKTNVNNRQVNLFTLIKIHRKIKSKIHSHQ